MNLKQVALLRKYIKFFRKSKYYIILANIYLFIRFLNKPL